MYYLLNYRPDLVWEKQWAELLKFYLPLADAVEFNLLFPPVTSDSQDSEINGHLPGFLWHHFVDNRIYPGNKVHYSLSQKVVSFFEEKSFASYLNCLFEDIALIANEREILATITHENYIIRWLTDGQLDFFKQRGFDFAFWAEE